MNKNKKKYIKELVCIVIICLMAGCTGNFEDYNTNPYNPTPEDMKGDNADVGSLITSMMPVLVQGHQNLSQNIDQMIGSEYGGQIANINPWTSLGGNFYTYNPSIRIYNYVFGTIMPQVYTGFFKIKEQTEGKGLVYAWAQILRVAASLKVSDCYGPIPYSKVTGSAYTVAYDNMEDLYKHMFEDLDAAISTIKAAVLAGEDFSSLTQYDYIYKGDFNKWIKFANTLKLRMALRLTNVGGAMEELAKQEAHDASYDIIGVMVTSSDAAYSSFNDGMNPYYRAGIVWNEVGEFNLSANISSYLSGYNDPRLTKYALSSKNGIVGVRNGMKTDANSWNTYATSCSKVNIGTNEPLLVMSASEAYFLRAEAALRGWDVNGTPKDLYEQGIKTAMEERNINDTGTYLASTDKPAQYTDPINSLNNAAPATNVCPQYDEKAGTDINLERIIVQKWIANFPNGWETWADIRRTGYPKLFPVINNLSTNGVNTARGMRRIPYPQEEYNTNKANVEAAVGMLGGADNAATDLWWAKKN